MFFDRLALLEEGTAEYQYARNTLIEMNLSLVRYAASRFRSRGQEMEDIVQVGTIGLIKAIDRFDIALENEFTTFAVPYIVGEIKRFFRDTTWSVHVPRRLQELRVDLARAREDLEGQGIHDPSVAELAEHLDLGQEEVIEGLVAATATAPIDRRPIETTGGRQQTGLVADLIGKEDPSSRVPKTFRRSSRSSTSSTTVPRTLLQLRFGAEMTQSEIGEELGISQMHVSRLLSRTCNHLREGLLAES